MNVTYVEPEFPKVVRPCCGDIACHSLNPVPVLAKIVDMAGNVFPLSVTIYTLPLKMYTLSNVLYPVSH